MSNTEHPNNASAEQSGTALIICTDCGGKISKRAAVCIHCGAPVAPTFDNESQSSQPDLVGSSSEDEPVRWCGTCRAQKVHAYHVVHTDRQIDERLLFHLIMMLVTAFLWIIVWIWLLNKPYAVRHYYCKTCRSENYYEEDSPFLRGE